jgi:glycosyltransferase involved in cell wall biosynthesis
MKILMLDPIDVNPYGPDLASALWGQGADVRLLVPIGFKNQERTRCPYEEISARGGRGRYVQKLVDEMRYLHRVWHLARRWRPDVIHVQWLRMNVEVHMVPKIRGLGIPVVITAHNVLPHERKPGDVTFQRRYYESADRVIAHEQYAREDLIRVLGISADRIDVVPPSMSEAPVPISDRASARCRLGLDPDATTFLWFGGVRQYKGQNTLLRAFESAVISGCGGQLVLGGWGRRHSVRALRANIDGLQPEARHRVHLRLGEDTPLPQTTVDDLFLSCDCVVLPYKAISHSSVLFQAFQYERPVLASSVGGFRQVVENEVNGRLVEADDEAGWARALMTLATSPDTLERWGREGRRRAIEKFGHAQVARRTLAVYERAIRDRRRG